MAFSDAEANAGLDARLAGAELVLYTVAPTDAGGGTEVTGGNYAAQPVPFAPAASRQASPAADTVSPQASAAWGDVVAIGLRRISDGHFIGWAPAAVVKTIDVDDIYVVKAAELIVRIS